MVNILKLVEPEEAEARYFILLKCISRSAQLLV